MANGLHRFGPGAGGEGLGELSAPLPIRPRDADLDQFMVAEGALEFGLHVLGEAFFTQGHHRVQPVTDPAQPFSGVVVEGHVVYSAKGAEF